MENSLISIGLIISYILLGITLIVVTIIPLAQFIKNFNVHKAKNTLIFMSVLLIVLVISFVVSTANVGSIPDQFGISPLQFRLIGGSIITTYILLSVTVLFAIYSEASNRFK